jgi:hypothetical protein
MKKFTDEFINFNSRMNRAIPGESLSNDPDNPYPFEAAPEFTVQREALEYMFDVLTEEERYTEVLTAIAKGVPIMELTQAMLFKGFSEGKWNPDLMFLLAEPVAYMLIALAERQGIDYIVHNEEANDEAADKEKFAIEGARERIKSGKVPVINTALPESIEEQIQELPVVENSLLNRPEQEDSLLAPQGA